MSRTGKKPILIPDKVKVEVKNNSIFITGPFGNLEQILPTIIGIKVAKIINNEFEIISGPGNFIIEGKKNEIHLLIEITNNSQKNRQLWGLFRTLINNMVIGVSKKFSKQLEMKGVGYKAQIAKTKLIINAGYSHPVEMKIPQGIEIEVERNTNLTISGIDKEKIGFICAQIRDIRPPEPYKGKGIMYKGEKIIRKAGKSAK